MRLYFLRHADAVDGFPDESRALSERGFAECRQIGRHLQEVDIRFDAVYSSPLLRARQTAEAVLEHAGQKAMSVQLAEALTNEYGDFGSWLTSIPEADHILLVGHMPSIAERTCRFLSMTKPGCLQFSKGSMACIETENRRSGVLRFFIGPKYLQG